MIEVSMMTMNWAAAMSASASQRRLLVELAAGAVVVMTVPVSARTAGGGCQIAEW
jgi:hypothetical protein